MSGTDKIENAAGRLSRDHAKAVARRMNALGFRLEPRGSRLVERESSSNTVGVLGDGIGAVSLSLVSVRAQ